MTMRLCLPLVDEVPTQRPAGGVEMPLGQMGSPGSLRAVGFGPASPSLVSPSLEGEGSDGPRQSPRVTPRQRPHFHGCPTGGASTQRHPHQPGGEGEADPLLPDRRWAVTGPGREGACGYRLCPGPGDAHGVCVPGPLINTIRVLCASYEDYSHWLLCLQTVSSREGAPLLPGPEGFPGLRGPLQVRVSRPWWAVMEQKGGGRGWAWVGGEKGPATRLTTPHPLPGPGQWPRLTLLRWTDQLGLGVPSTPL